MSEPTAIREKTGEELLGELSSLADQLGRIPGGVDPDATPRRRAFGSFENVSVLREFLQTYYAELLVARELPAIVQAHAHAHRSEVREFLAMDAGWRWDPKHEGFAGSSRHVGAAQLRRLRPLRDQRLVQRYLQAVEGGAAHGWHSMVYGLILSVYSLPLRQGLIHFGWQTIDDLVNSARGVLDLRDDGARILREEICAPLPQAVESILRNHGGHTGPVG